MGEDGIPARHIGFHKAELSRLLDLYSRRVADGQWRDYAIDLHPGRAVFSIFRNSLEGPLYTVSKLGPCGWEVARGPRRLSSTDSLDEALLVLERIPRVVLS